MGTDAAPSRTRCVTTHVRSPHLDVVLTRPLEPVITEELPGMSGAHRSIATSHVRGKTVLGATPADPLWMARENRKPAHAFRVPRLAHSVDRREREIGASVEGGRAALFWRWCFFVRSAQQESDRYAE